VSGARQPLRIVLYEGPGARPIDPDRKLAAALSLLEKGYTLSTAACPCEISEGTLGPMAVLGLFERPMPERMTEGGAALFFRDIEALAGPALIDAVAAIGAAAGTEAPGGWTPWFPVIDRVRCDDCGKCLSFCLFGVYEADGRRVRVARPASCKTNCPACARICPEAAIVFPKCPDAPINGDEIRDEQGVRAAMRVDVERILGADPYAALAGRKKRAERRLLRDPL
jgi:NAD-dependent dihydropyrimidine dehydrogenase PreA subunit